MATYYSDLAAKQQNFAIAKNLPTSWAGRVRIASGVYTPTGAEAAGAVIQLTRLPKGARLLGSSRLHFMAGQDASLTVKVGDSDNGARYLAAVSPGASAGSRNLDANVLSHTLLPDEDFIVLTTGGATLSKDKTIAFEIFYVID